MSKGWAMVGVRKDLFAVVVETLKGEDTFGLELDRSWLQDTLKRKLVDFAWNRRFFYLPGACSLFGGGNPAKSFNQPDFCYPERLF